jgi:hypothetical protein
MILKNGKLMILKNGKLMILKNGKLMILRNGKLMILRNGKLMTGSRCSPTNIIIRFMTCFPKGNRFGRVSGKTGYRPTLKIVIKKSAT